MSPLGTDMYYGNRSSDISLSIVSLPRDLIHHPMLSQEDSSTVKRLGTDAPTNTHPTFIPSSYPRKF